MWLLQTVEVNSDAEGDGNLVSAGVALADGAGAVVHLVGDVVHDEVLAEPRDEGGEVGVVGEREDGTLERSNDRGQREVRSRLVAFSHLDRQAVSRAAC